MENRLQDLKDLKTIIDGLIKMEQKRQALLSSLNKNNSPNRSKQISVDLSYNAYQKEMAENNAHKKIVAMGLGSMFEDAFYGEKYFCPSPFHKIPYKIEKPKK